MSKHRGRPTDEQQPQMYSLARRVLAADVEGGKRKRILAVIAAYQDEGHAPSVREIGARAKLTRPDGHVKRRAVLLLLQRLEADGLLRVEWATPPARNRYELQVDRLADPRAERGA